MSSEEIPLFVKIANQLHWVEKFFLIALGLGVLLKFLSLDTTIVIRLSLVGLAVIYFLNAYKLSEMENPEDQKFGFKELLASAILPKVSWISCSISVLAVFFYVIENKAYKQIAFIGSSTLIVVILLFAFLGFTEVTNFKKIPSFLLRGIPVLLVNLYIFLR